MLTDAHRFLAPFWRLCLTLCVGACSGGLNPNAGQTQVGSRNVSGDTGAPLSGIGYVAGCMAAVVEADKAVVAAHCVDNQAPESLSLLLGSDIGQPRARLPVLAVTPHPQYERNTRAFDVAVLRLGVRAQAAPLPVLDRLPEDASERTLLVAGFRASPGGTPGPSTVLQQVSLAQVTVEPLRLRWENSPPCLGDYAAPLIYRDMGGALLLAGLVAATTTADCSGASLATRLDVLAPALGLQTQTPAQAVAATPTVPDADNACGSVSSRGQCTGTQVRFCDAAGALQVQDCAATGAHCVWSYAAQQFACGPAPSGGAAAGCGGASFAGRCDGNVAVACRDGQNLAREDCTAKKFTCGYNLVLGLYGCLAPGTPAG